MEHRHRAARTGRKRLKEISGFGTYPSDNPVRVVQAVDRSVCTNAWNLNHLYYHKEDRTLGRLLAALNNDVQAAFSQVSLHHPLGRAIITALDVDTATAIALSEARLRLASAADLVPALVQLANVYQTADNLGGIDEILRARPKFVPPNGKGFVIDLDDKLRPSEGADVTTLWHKHQWAVARGDHMQAMASFRQFKTAAEREAPESPARQVLSEAETRLQRLQHGIGHGLDGGP